MKADPKSAGGIPKRLYALDAARGLAALAVVVWHFQHFYYLPGGGLPESFERSSQPFYPLLGLFYERGPAAVKLFFCLSGFIFFWLYLQKIRSRKESPGGFFRKRFSRLYPLHLATLLLVALIQIASLAINNNYIVYRYNDIKHFLLNLSLTSHWGLQDGWSFNAPVWSVSMEVFAYIFFFGFAFIGLGKLWHVLGVVLLSALAINYHPFGVVLFCFFSGGLAFMAFKYTTKKLTNKSTATKVNVAVLVAGTLVGLVAITTLASRQTGNLITWSLIFPGFIYLLAIVQTFMPNLGRSLKFLGDSSYAIYLTHFPVQALIILLARASGQTLTLDWLFFVPYIIFTVISSYYVYQWFEKPSMQLLRKQTLPVRNYFRFRSGQAGNVDS